MSNVILQNVHKYLAVKGGGATVVHCCTLSLCYLVANDHHRNPNINTEII